MSPVSTANSTVGCVSRHIQISPKNLILVVQIEEGKMSSFIEVHTTAGMQELVNVSAIQCVKSMKKFTQLVFIDEEPLDIVESYEDVKRLIGTEDSREAGTGGVKEPAKLSYE